MPHCFTALRAALLALTVVCALFAQRDLATVVGTVTDPSGLAIVNATVEPSIYSVSVSAPGFKKAEQHGIELLPGERTAVNITLEVGAANQTVEVTSSAPLLQTESTQVGAALNSRQVTDLPLGSTPIVEFLALQSEVGAILRLWNTAASGTSSRI